MTYKSNNNNSKIIIEEEKNANNNNNNKMTTALDFSALSATTASKVNAPNFGAPLTFGMGGNSAHASSGSNSGSKKIYRGAIAAQKSSHSSFMHGQNAVVFPSSTIIKGNVNSNAIPIAMPTMKIKSGLTTAAVAVTEDIGRMSDKSFYVPSKVRACTGLQNTPPIFNKCNSFLVYDSPQRCMQIIGEVFSDCDFEFEIEINNDAAENFVITGLVFVHNEPVLFKICVWSEMNGSRIEITRCKGHCLPFSDFMNATQKRLLKKLKGVNIDFGFESEEISDGSDFDFLPMSLDSMESLLLTTDDDDNDDSNDNSSSSNIMNVTYCDSDLELLADDILGDVFQLETLVAILKCASLKEKVSQNNSLFTAVQNCLNSTDAAVQRTAQKILSLA